MIKIINRADYRRRKYESLESYENRIKIERRRETRL